MIRALARRDAPTLLTLRINARISNSADLLSPGQLNLIFAVPADPPALAFPEALTLGQASAMQVPSTVELAAGSLQIVKAVGSLDDQVWTIDFTLPGLIKHVLELPELSPMDQRTVTLKRSARLEAGHSGGR